MTSAILFVRKWFYWIHSFALFCKKIFKKGLNLSMNKHEKGIIKHSFLEKLKVFASTLNDYVTTTDNLIING
jgi:hypothetical protein